jgi:hypothetical protein
VIILTYRVLFFWPLLLSWAIHSLLIGNGGIIFVGILIQFVWIIVGIPFSGSPLRFRVYKRRRMYQRDRYETRVTTRMCPWWHTPVPPEGGALRGISHDSIEDAIEWQDRYEMSMRKEAPIIPQRKPWLQE